MQSELADGLDLSAAYPPKGNLVIRLVPYNDMLPFFSSIPTMEMLCFRFEHAYKGLFEVPRASIKGTTMKAVLYCAQSRVPYSMAYLNRVAITSIRNPILA